MKICIATTTFPRWEGDGQGAFIFEAARAVSNQGVDVQVVTMHSPGLAPSTRIENIPVLRPRYFRPEAWEILKKEGGGLPITWQKYPWGRLQVLPFLLVHTLAISYYSRTCDLVHAHWTLSAGCAIAGRPLHHCPVLATLHGSDIFRVTKNPAGAWLTRQVLVRANRIVAVSQALANRVAELGHITQRLHVIPDGVDTARFTPKQLNDREDTILFVGSLIERKGVKYLLHAMADVLHSLPQYRLILLGNGPQELCLRTLAEGLGISGHVAFLGFQPQEEVRRWMQKAKLLVLPSLEEGLGVVLLEALASGTPIVASNVNGIPEVVVPEVGTLVPPMDTGALTAAILSILENPQVWAEMSQQARQRALNVYDWNHIAERWIALYKSML